MAQRGRPRKVKVDQAPKNLTEEQLKFMAGGDEEAESPQAFTENTGSDNSKLPGIYSKPYHEPAVWSRREGLIESLAISLMIEMCKSKGLSLDDHADYAVKSATKLADLLGVD